MSRSISVSHFMPSFFRRPLRSASSMRAALALDFPRANESDPVGTFVTLGDAASITLENLRAAFAEAGAPLRSLAVDFLPVLAKGAETAMSRERPVGGESRDDEDCDDVGVAHGERP